MAVTLTAIALAGKMRLGDGQSDLPEPLGSTIGGLLDSVTAMVERNAPDAPESVQNEAATRLAAFLFEAPVSRQSQNPMAQSGAGAMLAPWRRQRVRPTGD